MSIRSHPESCNGCPLNYLGAGFIDPEGSGVNGVLIVGEAAGEAESNDSLPFRPYAQAGSVLERCINRAGLRREEFALFNLVACRPPGNKLEGQKYERAAIDHCSNNLVSVIDRFKPRVLLALGNVPLKHLTGMAGPKKSISILRGFVYDSIYGIPVVPSLHPAFIARGASNYIPVLIRDLLYSVEVAKNGISPDKKNYDLHPTVAKVREYLHFLVDHSKFPIGYDIETDYSLNEPDESDVRGNGKNIVQIQFSHEIGHAIVLPWVGEYIELAREILNLPNDKWGWNNWGFDDPILEEHNVQVAGQNYDLMWCWHHLQPDLPRSLQFVASFYAPELQAWKHLSDLQPQFYGGVDVDALSRIGKRIFADLDRAGVRRGYDKHIFQLNGSLKKMCARGFPIDVDGRKAFRSRIEEKARILESEINSKVPQDLRKIHPTEGFKTNPKEVREIAKILGVQLGKKRESIFPEDFKLSVKANVDLDCKIFDDGNERFFRQLPFLASSDDQIKSYIRAKGHKMPVKLKERDTRGNPKETTEKKGLERLYKQTGDDFYLKVIESRELQKIASTYIDGWKLDEDGRVHSEFSFVPATGQLSSRNPNIQNCFSPDTEILTRRGWIAFPHLRAEDNVAQYNSDTGDITFCAPLQLIKQQFQGNLHKLTTEEQINLCVTPEHECLLKNRQTGKFVKIPARGFKSDHHQIQAGTYRSDGEHLSWAQIALLAALQADGSIDKVNNLSWKFKKLRKINRLRNALREEQIDFAEYNYASGHIGFYVAHRNVPEWLKDKKYFDSWILKLDSQSFQCLANEIWFWDGCWTTKSNYSSNVKLNVDWAQILTVLSNRRARIRSYWNKNPKARINWQIDVAKRNYSITTNFTRELIPYQGFVYCVTVPTGNVVVRRRNQVAITGNCPKQGDLADEFRKIIRPKSGHVFVEFDYTAFHALTLGFEAKDLDYMRLARLDIHSYLAGHLLRLSGCDSWLQLCDEDLEAQLAEIKSAHKSIRDRKAKPTILGYGFGLGASKLYDMNLESFDSKKEAQNVIDMLNSLFPATARFREDVKKLASGQGFLLSKHGYIRRFYDIYGYRQISDKYEPTFGEKVFVGRNGKRYKKVTGEEGESAIAFLPANDAFGHIKDVILRLEESGLNERYRFVNQLHDALLFECPKSLLDACLEDVSTEMELPSTTLIDSDFIPRGLACGIEASVGENWFEMDKVYKTDVQRLLNEQNIGNRHKDSRTVKATLYNGCQN